MTDENNALKEKEQTKKSKRKTTTRKNTVRKNYSKNDEKDLKEETIIILGLIRLMKKIDSEEAGGE